MDVLGSLQPLATSWVLYSLFTPMVIHSSHPALLRLPWPGMVQHSLIKQEVKTG